MRPASTFDRSRMSLISVQQMPSGRMDVLEVVVLLLVELAEQPLEQHFGKADDRVERRAQLVRHVREEFRLVLVGDLELAALVLDLAEQPRVLDGDHRLVGEGLEQRDVLVGEAADIVAANEDRADAFALPDHRREDRRLDADRLAAATRVRGHASRRRRHPG